MNMDDPKLLELTRIIHEMVLEVGELKERVAYLEDYIRTMSRYKEPIPTPPQPEIAATVTKEDIREDAEDKEHQKLIDLYASGYHVCPISFGELRQGDCLFCVAMMEKK